MGEAPYEAFCMGGSNSIRGWYDCDLAVSKAFSELTVEYRFPLVSILSGEVFMDAGTDFGTQKDVPGKPGLLLTRTAPVFRWDRCDRHHTGGSDPPGGGQQGLRLHWRFNLGVGWKF